MDATRRKYQIVYLIDTSLAECEEDDHCPEVLLTVLRLLFLFHKSCSNISDKWEHKTHKGQSGGNRGVGIKWGFKFFNTAATIPRNKIDTPSFRSLKLSHLEDFEKKTKDIFVSVKKDTAKRRSLSHPAELLSTALTEILHDFKWNEDDIFTSPVTRRRGHHSLEENSSKNVVFLLARAPCSSKSLRRFSNKMVIDSEVFLDSFMSPALLHEYQQKIKVSLHWIDLSSNCCAVSKGFQEASSIEGLDILKDTCKTLGGRFLSKDLILSYMPTRSINDNDCDTHELMDPLQIIGSFPSESRLISVKTADTSVTAHKIQCSLTSQYFQDEQVNLTPVFKKMNQSSRANVLTCLDMAAESNGSPTTTLQSHKMQSTDLSDAYLTVLGCVPQADVCDLVVMQASSSFLLDCDGGSAVSSLLLKLLQSESLAILGVRSKSNPLVTMALLKAQSEIAGFITFLNFGQTFFAEKVLLQQSIVDEESVERDSESDNHDHNTRSTIMEQLNSDVKKLTSLETQGPTTWKSVEEGQVFQSYCMNSWYIPGGTAQMSSLLTKLTDRLDALDHLSKTEKGILKQLQKHYTKEKRPKEVVENLQPSTSTPMCAFRNIKMGSSGGSESGSRSSQSGHHRQQSVTLSRGRMMVDKARSTSFAVTEDGSNSSHSKPGSPQRRLSTSMGLAALDMKTEEDLESYLKKQYDQVLNAGIAMDTTIQTMVTVTSLFMSNKQVSNPQKSAVNFIQKALAVNSSKLREKYLNRNSEEDKRNKTAEYKLQVMLLLEMESLIRDTDTAKHELLSELVALLRALSFLVGATKLREFLTDVVTASYSVTLPKLLVDIFDELMLPLPPALAQFASPMAPSSVWGAPLSVTNDDSLHSAPGSSQPPSHLSDQSSQHAKRSSKFKQHPSIADFRQKKQILVKPKEKPKLEAKKTGREKVKRAGRSTRTRHGDYDRQRAKRNLFSDKAKPGLVRVREKARSSHRRRHKHSSSAEKSRTLVLGTPAHKQTSKRFLQQQERRRRHENIETDVQVVAESPVKEDDGPVSALNRPARYIVREAFYSSNSQPSRNLARSIELAQKGSGPTDFSQGYLGKSTKSQGTLASAVRGESPLSPQSRLLKSFMTSPSPTPKTRLKVRQISTTPLRRSPRKSAKKLEFSRAVDIQNGAQSGGPTAIADAHLVFDGENANDFAMLTYSRQQSPSRTFTEGFRTPEKRKVSQKSAILETASCPPIMVTPPKPTTSKGSSPRLSFRNILSQDMDGAENSSHNQTSNLYSSLIVSKTPDKEAPKSPVFTSPYQSIKQYSGVMSRSPRQATLTPVLCGAVQNAPGKLGISPSNRQRKRNHSNSEPPTTPTRGSRSLQEAEHAQIELMSPNKQLSPRKAWQVQTTPSKVKFLDSCLISPPTGSGHPLSAEKSTPGKSILKSSPIIKGKVKRRVELQPVAETSRLSSSLTFINSPVHSGTRPPLMSHIQGISQTNPLPLPCDPENFKLKGAHGKHSESESIIRQKLDVGSEVLSRSNLRHSIKQSTRKSREAVAAISHDTGNTQGGSTCVRERHDIDLHSSSSEDSLDSFPQKAGATATVTIRTPSPTSKSKGGSINKWARRKRSSSKNSSSSSSSSIVSPTSSSKHDGKVRHMSGTLAQAEGKENSEMKMADQEFDWETGSKITEKPRKRSLFSITESTTTQSPSKRARRNSGPKAEEHVISNASFDRIDTDVFVPAHSPELITWEEETVFPAKRKVSHHHSSSQNASSLSQVSLETASNSSISHPISAHHSPYKRLTRQVSGTAEEGSLGFQMHIPPSSAQDTRNVHGKVKSSLCETVHSLKSHDIKFESVQPTSSRQRADNTEFRAQNSINNAMKVSSPKSIPSVLTQPLSKQKSTTSVSSTNSGNSPSGSTTSSPDRKQQFSPSLSATGLLHLIKSPLLSPRSKRDENLNADGQPRVTRSKSRKHLDLN